MNVIKIICIALNICLFSIEAMRGKSDFSYLWGYNYRQGKKNVDEDRYTVIPTIKNNNQRAIFALFDGHLGSQAANLAAEKMGPYLIDSLKMNPNESVLTSLQNAFAETEKNILAATNAGTTASVAYLDGNSINLAWIGDSKILVLPSTGDFFETSEHRPNNITEQKRLNALFKSENIWGKLNLVRALGNKKSKDAIPGMIIATPEVKSLPLNEETLLIIASDGYWDIFSAQQTKELLKKYMNYSIPTLQAEFPLNRGQEKSIEEGDLKLSLVARALVENAYKFNSPDNIAVLVVQIIKNPTTQHQSNWTPQGKSPILATQSRSSADSNKNPTASNHPLRIANVSTIPLHITINVGSVPQETLFVKTINPNSPVLYTGMKTITRFPVNITVKNGTGSPVEFEYETTKSHNGELMLNNEELKNFMDPTTPDTTVKEVRLIFDNNPKNPHSLILKKPTFSLYKL